MMTRNTKDRRTILIVEDDPSIAEILEYNLNHEGYETRKAGDGLQALEEARREPPDLVLLDLMLPGMNGLDLCRHLKADPATAAAPVIMLTVRSSEQDVVTGLDSGAEDYITKPFRPRELLARVRSVFRRDREGAGGGKNLLSCHGLVLDLEKREALLEGKPVALSKTEFEILALLMTRPGKVFSRAEILRRCWPEGVRVVDRSVDVHINSIRKKLKRLRVAIETVRGIGYRVKE